MKKRLLLNTTCLSLPGMASTAVKDRLNHLGQGVLQPATGLAALAAILRATAGVSRSALHGKSGAIAGAGADPSPAVVTVNPFKWKAYLGHLKVSCHRLHRVLW